MKALFFLDSENYSKMKNKISEDDLVSRQSINFREGKALGLDKDGYYLEIDGSEESIVKVKEIIGDLGTEVTGDEKKKVLAKIEEQQNNAAAGFGSIFG